MSFSNICGWIVHESFFEDFLLHFSSVSFPYFFNINVLLMVRLICTIRLVNRFSNGVTSALASSVGL